MSTTDEVTGLGRFAEVEAEAAATAPVYAVSRRQKFKNQRSDLYASEALR